MPWLTLVPPLLTIALAIATRRVLLSLTLGIVVAALLLADFNLLGTLQYVAEAFISQAYSAEDGFDSANLLILVFLFQLGVLTTLVMMSGGSRAFSDWISEKVSSRRSAQGLGLGMAFALFVDDYFSALAVGQVARPVTDKFRVSRAKLAYIVDSTAAPMTVLVPFSSWGASIIGLLSPVIAASALGFNDVAAFLGAAVANYYAIAALLIVIAAVITQLDIGPMRVEERRAIFEGKPHADGEKIPGEINQNLPIASSSGKRSLIAPLVALTLGVVGLMFFTGWLQSGSVDPIEMLGETMLSESLVLGGFIGLAVSVHYYLKYTKDEPETFTGQIFWAGVLAGLKSMATAVLILLLAWGLGNLIDEIGTGDYLAHLIDSANMGANWLPAVLFLVAGFMAFSTGTSWGSFGVLIPLAGSIINGLNADDYLLVSLGAVLAGAVLGDHISPISDTTILSSAGSQANIITHVRTQLPYAMIAALAALVGYVVSAFTTGPWWGLLAMIVALAVALIIAKTLTTSLEAEFRESLQKTSS